jgi:hypothetical protein
MDQRSIVRANIWMALWLNGAVATLGVSAAYAQQYEITPLVGARLGGTIDLEQAGVPNFKAHLADSITFGVAMGFRFDGDDCEKCNLVEFRWMRQNTHLTVKQDPLVATPYNVSLFRPAVSLDHYLADFTHEWTASETPYLSPFVTATLGAAYLSGPASGATRFVFGISTGIKVFPARNWGFRVQVEYLPMVMHAELQTLVCTGGCVVVLTGGLMNQFNVTIGPAFRF